MQLVCNLYGFLENEIDMSATWSASRARKIPERTVSLIDQHEVVIGCAVAGGDKDGATITLIT